MNTNQNKEDKIDANEFIKDFSVPEDKKKHFIKYLEEIFSQFILHNNTLDKTINTINTNNSNQNNNTNKSNTSIGLDTVSFNKYYELPGLISYRLFSVFNTSNTNILKLNEFLTGMLMLFCSDFQTQAKLIFDIFDFNSDGFINTEDILIIFRYIPLLDKNKKIKQSKNSLNNPKSNIKYISQMESTKEIETILEIHFKTKKNKNEFNFEEFMHVIEEIHSELVLYVLIYLLDKKPFDIKSLNEHFISPQNNNFSISTNKQTILSNVSNTPQVNTRMLIVSPSIKRSQFAVSKTISKSPMMISKKLNIKTIMASKMLSNLTGKDINGTNKILLPNNALANMGSSRNKDSKDNSNMHNSNMLNLQNSKSAVNNNNSNINNTNNNNSIPSIGSIISPPGVILAKLSCNQYSNTNNLTSNTTNNITKSPNNTPTKSPNSIFTKSPCSINNNNNNNCNINPTGIHGYYNNQSNIIQLKLTNPNNTNDTIITNTNIPKNPNLQNPNNPNTYTIHVIQVNILKEHSKKHLLE